MQAGDTPLTMWMRSGQILWWESGQEDCRQAEGLDPCSLVALYAACRVPSQQHLVSQEQRKLHAAACPAAMTRVGSLLADPRMHTQREGCGC